MSMPKKLQIAFDREWKLAVERRRNREFEAAFAHLERAHIISQRYTGPHLRSHAAMWVVGLQRRDWREVWGQPLRMLAALLFSRIWVPPGNTGGANVSAIKPMPVPADLRQLLAEEC